MLFQVILKFHKKGYSVSLWVFEACQYSHFVLLAFSMNLSIKEFMRSGDGQFFY